MKFALLALGFIAAGVVGGVTSNLLRPEQSTVAPDDSPDRITAELSDLRNLVQRQGDEIRALRDAGLVADETGRLPAAPPLDSEVDAPDAAAAGPDLENTVAKIMEKKDQEEREARTERINAMMAEREKARLKRLQEELGLTDYQAEELDKIFTERRNAMMAVRDKVFEGGRENLTQEQFAEMRASMEKLRTDSEEQIKSLLSSDQYESYKKQDTGGRGPGSFGGGRGPGRGR